jgi:hypothetical protein
VRRLSQISLATLILLSACGEPAEERVEAPEPGEETLDAVPARPASATADLELGQFDSAVGDLVAYESAPFGFQSLIFAGNGAAGIASVRADGGEVGMIDIGGTPPYRLAVAYDEAGEGQLFAMDDAGSLQSFSLPSAEPLPTNDIGYPMMRDLCSNGSTVMAVDGAGGRVLFGLDDGTAASVPNGTIACQGVGEDFYVRTADGWSLVTPAGAEPTPLDPDADTLIGAGDEVFALRVDGAGAALILNGAAVKTFRGDGTPLRPLKAVPAYGNLGGVTRDGALIVLDEERRLYLLPWAEVATALNLPSNLPSRRPGGDARMGEAPVFPDIEVAPPSFEFEAPEVETPEPPLPPGR